jgi:hypothetical protein
MAAGGRIGIGFPLRWPADGLYKDIRNPIGPPSGEEPDGRAESEGWAEKPALFYCRMPHLEIGRKWPETGPKAAV